MILVQTKEGKKNARRKYYAKNRVEINRKRREYQAENREKTREWAREYYKKNSEKLSKRSSERRRKNLEKIKKMDRERYAKHRDKERERARQWRLKHNDRVKKEARERYAKHRPKILKQRKKRFDEFDKPKRLELKNKVFTHYSKKISNSDIPCCACCLETMPEFLALDHINGRKSMGHPYTLTGHALYRRIEKDGFPDGLQILCHNCNTAKGTDGVCPHKK